MILNKLLNIPFYSICEYATHCVYEQVLGDNLTMDRIIQWPSHLNTLHSPDRSSILLTFIGMSHIFVGIFLETNWYNIEK